MRKEKQRIRITIEATMDCVICPEELKREILLEWALKSGSPLGSPWTKISVQVDDVTRADSQKVEP